MMVPSPPSTSLLAILAAQAAINAQGASEEISEADRRAMDLDAECAALMAFGGGAAVIGLGLFMIADLPACVAFTGAGIMALSYAAAIVRLLLAQ